MAPCKMKKAAKTKRISSKVKRNTRSHHTSTAPQKSPSQNTHIKQEEGEKTSFTTLHYPKTPLNSVHPLSMSQVRNSIRRAEFKEYIALGITPLEGKGSGIAQGAQGTTNLLVDEGVEEELARTWQDCRNDQESNGLKWLRERLWGKGRWAVRMEEEDDLLYVVSALGEEEWRALWA
ncbi:hypothetical protein COCC4DRAFT_23443 [Bipolaris maydis ATCC 48331]|uniref:Uncharacterized protein n=2 Tax=Cochliobolus heterostrophus TaxID=5016 RepID=M2UN85_COCH5|nr:uncharacterized protein COCC4DRAFT_23443 [Bipolaris maydis ATCC 48331]EMD89357.1 hypothetical protein COCHEDRAFT_1108166 [Bipolaris maydis C5]ENI04926.1 hypothetical protein COCC4DRAFT_23443 [Bipolaris maydis ATCC 48331]KAJ6266010.1 hypothetical protein PSV08DRAFT_356260 [Bipolaris maydis]KAJ6281027.1 hypothetical protein J3E71DRAFT_343139 [Bipolaris maydis]